MKKNPYLEETLLSVMEKLFLIYWRAHEKVSESKIWIKIKLSYHPILIIQPAVIDYFHCLWSKIWNCHVAIINWEKFRLAVNKIINKIKLNKINKNALCYII